MTADPRTSAQRPHRRRFIPGSLTARLLAVLLVPMIGLQVFAVLEVRRQSQFANDAAAIRRRLELLQVEAEIIVPFAVESVLAHGLLVAGGNGLRVSDLTAVLNFDLAELQARTRVELDEGIATLIDKGSDLVLVNGTSLADELRGARDLVHAARAAVDDGVATLEGSDFAYARLTAVMVQLNQTLGADLDRLAHTGALTRVSTRTVFLGEVLGSATEQWWTLAQAVITDTGEVTAHDIRDSLVKVATELDQLSTLLTPEQRLRLEALEADPDVQSAAVLATAVADRLEYAGPLPPHLLESADDITLVVDAFLANLNRLQHLGDFGAAVVAQGADDAARIEADAERSLNWAMAVMAASLLLSGLLVALVLRSVLGPLRRLVRAARQVSRGDLDAPHLPVTGPGDVRVLTRAFNEMTATLHDYDQQVQRLARGETPTDHLPGTLGDGLRRSVLRLTEVTEALEHSKARALQLARTDPLTGLANRAAALERLQAIGEHVAASGRFGAVLFLDLDGFKSVNDSHGHSEGDTVLREVGRRLVHACPAHTVARFGGDEFMILVEQTAAIDDVVRMAKGLIEIVGEPCIGTNGQEFVLSASAGIAVIDDSSDPSVAVARADSALYHAKELGRRRVEVFDKGLAGTLERRAAMSLTMRQAISNGEFFVRLQPIIDLQTGRAVGAEALVRWQRPGAGEVPPGEFIPVAERTGVVLDIDAFVLQQAAIILRNWRDDPRLASMRLSVNISGRHLGDAGLAEEVNAMYTEAGVDVSRLDIELTETHLVADVVRASSVVDALRHHGIHVAIDDFGTGYAAMSYLHQLSVDALKIDKMFVDGLFDEDGLDRTIVELLLRLGDTLGLQVVAEGVDTEEKLVLLRELGCPLAQGYHIAMPMRVDEATAWLAARSLLADAH